MQADGHDKPMYGQHHTRPCQERKSGAPTVPERERKTWEGGPPAASETKAMDGPAPHPPSGWLREVPRPAKKSAGSRDDLRVIGWKPRGWDDLRRGMATIAPARRAG